MEAEPTHIVLVTVFPGVDAFDVAGPAEVFTMANHLLSPERPRYEIRFVGPSREAVRTTTGLRVQADLSFDEFHGHADTVIVCGRMDVGPDGPYPVLDPEVTAWLATAGEDAGRVAAVCAGSHIAAAAGLLDGHRATTHWATAPRLAADHPLVEVDADPIFVRSGRVWTSAGITSSLDLALALVAEDHGDDMALQVAQIMVMYVQRPGGQSQFSVPLAARPGGRDDVAELRRWIGENLDADLSVGALAERLSVSPRHLARVFRTEVGATPGEYVEGLRVEQARRLLERTRMTPAAIAAACGLGSVETLHRVFRTRLGTTPGDYRRRFTSAV
ncbi:GlxA family transcriptional regulator [Streptomyces sp. NPDC026672]|uniref:GlxA family transcriptional regulator n=1 Tax=unclassified Streptomyces TaxID=2593676 RepID=UPI0033FA36CF